MAVENLNHCILLKKVTNNSSVPVGVLVLYISGYAGSSRATVVN